MNTYNFNIFESVLIGTGGGYGESQVVNLGDGHWVVIDSCINPSNKSSLPLQYLESINVDVKSQVKLIICTHWHDDHIRGMSQLVDRCENAIFCCARTTDRQKFLRLVGLDHRKEKFDATTSSTEEFSKCLSIISKRNGVIRSALEDRLLLSHKSENINCDIYALSPSDSIVDKFDTELSELITEYGPSNRKIVIETPNSKSVVILMKINQLNVLFGSDLEVDLDDDSKGWLRILNHSQVVKGSKSSLYKVPHHGSENGNHQRIWDELLVEMPISKLTPWNRNKKLPKADMLNYFNNLSEGTYITSIFRAKDFQPKVRDNSISKAIRKFKPSLREVRFNYGAIICKSNVNNAYPTWCVEVEGSALRVDYNIITQF